MTRADVVVLGAGVAGLAAARALSQAGRSVVVVEARPRIGGRIFTRHESGWPLPVELGAEFLHGAAEATREVAQAASARVVELPDTHVWAERGRLRPMDKMWEGVAALLKRARRLRRDAPFAAWMARQKAPADVRRSARLFVEGYSAGAAARTSAMWMGDGAEGVEDMRQYRMESGYDVIARWLRAGLDAERTEVRLGTTATAIDWSRGAVRVHLRSATGRTLPAVTARAAVVTLPIGVLKAPDGPEFRPRVPGLSAVLSRLEPGAVRKVLLRFREAFWEEEGFFESRLPRGARDLARTVSFLHHAAGAFPTWWTAAPRQVPVLTAWAGGPAAQALANLAEPAIADRALDALSRMVGVPRARLDLQLEGWATHDWQEDPFSRGAYTYVAVGGREAPTRLARPVRGTLFFAGEATSEDETGTVAGAIASGLGAARKLEAAR